MDLFLKLRQFHLLYDVKAEPGNRPACTSKHVATHVCLSQLQKLLNFCRTVTAVLERVPH